jgi:hypothetical protein
MVYIDVFLPTMDTHGKTRVDTNLVLLLTTFRCE